MRIEGEEMFICYNCKAKKPRSKIGRSRTLGVYSGEYLCVDCHDEEAAEKAGGKND